MNARARSEDLPELSELRTPDELVRLNPGLLTENRLRWALQNRRTNGLIRDRVVFESPLGKGIVIHEPAFLRWLLGLSGRAKPRAQRPKSRAARAWRARRANSSASPP